MTLQVWTFIKIRNSWQWEAVQRAELSTSKP